MDDIAPSMSDNEALRRLVAQGERAVDALVEDYDHIVGDTDLVAVSDSTSKVREAFGSEETEIVKTSVISAGPNTVYIRENGKIIHIIPAVGGSWVSPLAGDGRIECICESGKTAQVAIATYIRGAVPA